MSPYYKELQWLKVHSRRLFFVGSWTFSILHSKRPLILYDGFEFKSNKILRTTRTLNDTLILSIYRTECYKKYFRRSVSCGMAYPPIFAMLLVCIFSNAKNVIIYSNRIIDLILCHFLVFCLTVILLFIFYFYFYLYFSLLFTYKHFSFLYGLRFSMYCSRA